MSWTLALDTSTVVEAALVHDGRVAAAGSVDDARAHAEQLAPLVQRLLAEAGIAPGDLTSIVVGVGPGPFTGLRVGVATGMTLVIAFNYGSRDEIARAAARLAADVQAGKLDPSQIDAQKLNDCLDTAGIPDPDLVIRTSGEERLSNFLLWQAAYAELMFVPDFWPDFTPALFDSVLERYASRDHRFGGLSTKAVAVGS